MFYMKLNITIAAFCGSISSFGGLAFAEYVPFEPVGEPIRVDIPESDDFVSGRALIRQYSVTLSDQYFDDQYYFLPPTGEHPGQSDVLRAMELVSGGPQVNVAVADNDYWLHEDIGWSSPNLAFYPDTPLDENGQIIIEEYDPDYSRVFNDYIDPTDYFYDCTRAHGTYVGGVIGATSDNSVGIAGIGNVSLVPLRTYRCGSTISGWTSASAYVLDLSASSYYPDYATDPTPIVAKVLNYSFGSSSSCTAQTPIDEFTGAGAIIVVAAGNESTAIEAGSSSGGSSPANCNNVITVGSVNRSGNPSWFTNYGPGVDVSAIGEEVLTTGMDNGYYRVNGTSFSAPIVSGVISLALAEFPAMGTSDLKTLLRQTARPYVISVNSPCSTQAECGGGILDAKRFIEQVFIFNGISQIYLSDAWDSQVRSQYASALEHFKDDINTCDRSELVISQSVFEFESNRVRLFSDTTDTFLTAQLIGEFTTTASLINEITPDGTFYGYQICDEFGYCDGNPIQLIDTSSYTQSNSCT